MCSLERDSAAQFRLCLAFSKRPLLIKGLDNIGGNSDLVHEETIKNVVDEYPRLGWSKCFAATIREENGLKPWAHTTALGEDDFPNGVLGNKLMEPYE